MISAVSLAEYSLVRGTKFAILENLLSIVKITVLHLDGGDQSRSPKNRVTWGGEEWREDGTGQPVPDDLTFSGHKQDRQK